MQIKFRPETRRPADDHATNVISPHIARNHTIRDQESRCTGMVRDDTVRCEVGEHFFRAIPGQGPHTIQGTLEKIYFVVRIDPLKNGDDPLKTHASIHMLGRQRFEGILIDAVVLDKNVIPQFEIAGTFPIDPASMGFAAQVIEFLTAVHVDLGTGSARTCFSHFPKILFTPKKQDMRRLHAGLLLPNICSFIIGRDIALVILEAGGIQAFSRQAPYLREKLPGPADGFLLIVIAK